MRRITLWTLSTLSALVLLFSYHTSTSAGASPTIVAEAPITASADPGTTDPGTTDRGGPDLGGTGAQTPAPEPAGGSGTFTGAAVSTRYGDVQVRITVEAGAMVKAEVTRVPWSDRRDQEINSRAVPILNSEAVAAQSAQIDMVSGATYTSEGYRSSLQSALDEANL